MANMGAPLLRIPPLPPEPPRAPDPAQTWLYLLWLQARWPLARWWCQ